ncbi:hypothetical protein CMU02_08995 [Elizabethkingia anophelis]|uniref:hypothetical protein n=1 Tax=Elizabethkingia anophelis TaxID=1117645 RepID=UPI00293CBECB|nr:hypothetical protein [Elizabethkingia anophelis]MDV3904947.1 hypothetical protein [Elizabethkingia anophelis]
MKRLEEIKNEYSLQLAKLFDRKFTSWEGMINTDFEYGTGISKVYDIEQLMDEVAKRYAREVAQASLEKAAENARTKTNRESTSIVVNKESITNEQNIVIL